MSTIEVGIINGVIKMRIFLLAAAILILLIILYFWMIMPRIFGKPSKEPLMHHYYAHRGFYDNEKGIPENSIRAFQMAVDKGYGIELDVQLTKDKIPIVFHDSSLKRVCQQEGNIKDYTYEELQKLRLCFSEERIPKLQEVLQLVNGRTPLIIEIKCETRNTKVCQYVYEQLQDYKGVYCIESFNPFVVRWFRKRMPNLVSGQLSTDFMKSGKRVVPLFFVGHLLSNFIDRPDFIAYDCVYKKEISRNICRKLYGALSVAWTVKSREQFEAVKKDFDLFIFEGFEPEKA